MESEESAGGAAQRVVPQRARGCAAVLCFLAVRSCKASPCALVSCWEAPVHQQPGTTAEEASDVLVPMRCGRSSARRALRKLGHARPRAMARDVRNQSAIATRFLS